MNPWFHGIALLMALMWLRAVAAERISFAVTPAKAGVQLVRTSLPLPPGFLHTNETLRVVTGAFHSESVGLRVVSWHPTLAGQASTARRAVVTFSHRFADLKPVRFEVKTARLKTEAPAVFPVKIVTLDDHFELSWTDGSRARLQFVATPPAARQPPRLEVVEDNRCYRWHRLHVSDSQWPRVLEVRLDVTGQVLLVGHVQRRTGGDADPFAPELGWNVEVLAPGFRLQTSGVPSAASNGPSGHSFRTGDDAVSVFGDTLQIYHPAAPGQRRGGLEIQRGGQDYWSYRYRRCLPADAVPMQPMSWRSAGMVLAPSTLARVTPTLQPPHRVEIAPKSWAALYPTIVVPGQLPQELATLVQYHRDAIIRSVAVGDDAGNVTGFNDGSKSGGNFGMNRLNHGAAIFEDGWRSGDRRLIETGLGWCENFLQQSIWWGVPEPGGTRYNNVVAMNRTPPTSDYMWRSDSSVNFCTKGYDCFWLAWEETGDPRMLEALRAQTAYAAQSLHANVECRNIGDVRDFIRLHQYTGDRHFLDESLRLFRELRPRISTGHLFDQGGKPIDPDPPFINDDQVGLKQGFAKPYIIGYALAGLPELIRYAPDEPELKATVRAVADFVAATVVPAGGWRYPHPRSSEVLISQGLEHAWQLTQAARVLGPEPQWLDAIETVLRARIQGWRRTGRILSGLSGWELSTGKVTDNRQLAELYRKPADRDPARDHREGRVGFGSAPPEGLVYFPEVLGYYLQHRSADRLLMPPRDDEPLGQVLGRSAGKPK